MPMAQDRWLDLRTPFSVHLSKKTHIGSVYYVKHIRVGLIDIFAGSFPDVTVQGVYESTHNKYLYNMCNDIYFIHLTPIRQGSILQTIHDVIITQGYSYNILVVITGDTQLESVVCLVWSGSLVKLRLSYCHPPN